MASIVFFFIPPAGLSGGPPLGARSPYRALESPADTVLVKRGLAGEGTGIPFRLSRHSSVEINYFNIHCNRPLKDAW